MEPRYKHQDEFLKQLPVKHLLCWDMGTGKTRTSIEWAVALGVKPLIIVPKGLVKGWMRECEKWGLSNYTLITKEKFRSLAHQLPKHDAVIVDEAHYFAGKSQMHKSLLLYVQKHQPHGVVCLTGTPYMRNAWNVFRLGLILGVGHDGKYTFWNWHWFDTTFFNRIRMGFRVVPVQKSDEASKEKLAQLVKLIGSTKHLSECADVPVSQEYKEVVEMTKEQTEYIANMTDIEPMVRYTKLQQVMGGATKGSDFTLPERIKSNKLERLMELVNQQDRVLVVCRYIHEIDLLSQEISKTGRRVFVLHGGTEDRDGIVQEARKHNDCVLIVGAQISEGWEAPEFETMIFYSHSFSLKDYVQMKGRIQRINNLKPRCYVHLIVEDSVDEDIYKSLMNKEDFLAHIYAEARSKNNSTTKKVHY